MSYVGISVKEAINKINNNDNGWFLPAVQRPYVWGSRYEGENYICKLFDSILNGYPIGGLILWNTRDEIPYREFMRDYMPNDLPKIVDKGLHNRSDKWLVYDGQQRLQTLFSCLKYTFNNRILIYDLLFKPLDSSETGFFFANKSEEIPWHNIRMTELFSRNPKDHKSDFRKVIYNRKHSPCTPAESEIIEKNVDKLWDTFVGYNEKTLAFFSINDSSEDKVNEIFERLNTGGMALSQADLLLSKIKAHYYDFEEQLQQCTRQIRSVTSNGFEFQSYSILQTLFLIIYGTTRVDPKKVKDNDIASFKEVWTHLEPSIISFFSKYIWEQFKINNASIIPRQLALLPIIVYAYELEKKKIDFNKITPENLNLINTYFIKSQINDWNLQTYVDNFAKLIAKASLAADKSFDFPLADIEEYVESKGNRFLLLYENNFTGYTWFCLKILMPGRIFQFDGAITGRFNPEIDHIFPSNLKEKTSEYDSFVDLIWNKQPTRGEINNLKSNIHPKPFFSDSVKNSKNEIISGSKFVNEYDYMPKDSDNTIDLQNIVWDDIKDFVNFRRIEMLKFLKLKYGIELLSQTKTETTPTI